MWLIRIGCIGYFMSACCYRIETIRVYFRLCYAIHFEFVYDTTPYPNLFVFLKFDLNEIFIAVACTIGRFQFVLF